MSKPDKQEISSAIANAIRAKRDRRAPVLDDIASLEASLLADLETFDLDAAERRAQREQLANSGAGMVDANLVFPEIVPTPVIKRPASTAQQRDEVVPPEPVQGGPGLLDQLRQQAEIRQRQIHEALAERTTTNEAIDQALKHLFFYFHELVQQLNILKPLVLRSFPLIENYALAKMAWNEGFADYRTQSQSKGALVELVSMTYRLSGDDLPPIERSGPGVERFRTMLFDYGLPFTCKETKNERQYVESASFQIRSEISVSARWRADFAKGMLILETRNLERLGSAVYTLRAENVDQALLEAFGRLLLGQPSHFRELANRK